MASDHPDDAPEVAKSAEDRKAASALASLNDNNDAASPQARSDVDQAAVSAAMKKLGGGKGTTSLPVRKNVKIDQADVAILVDELDLSKPKATELLKAHDGNAVQAMKAFVQVRI